MAARSVTNVPPMSAGEIRALRERYGLTQTMLAHLIGRVQPTVKMWENPVGARAARCRPVGGVAVLLRLIDRHGPRYIRVDKSAELREDDRIGPMPAERVVAIRLSCRASRLAIARTMNVTIDTVKAWEIRPQQTRSRTPGRDAAILLALAERHGLDYVRLGPRLDRAIPALVRAAETAPEPIAGLSGRMLRTDTYRAERLGTDAQS